MITETMNKLKERFSLEWKYQEYRALNQITDQMFSEIDRFTEGKDDENVRAIKTAKSKAVKAFKEANIAGFVKQIDIICFLFEVPLVSEDTGITIKKDQTIREKTEEIEQWVKDKKEAESMDLETVLRIKKKVLRILERL